MPSFFRIAAEVSRSYPVITDRFTVDAAGVFRPEPPDPDDPIIAPYWLAMYDGLIGHQHGAASLFEPPARGE